MQIKPSFSEYKENWREFFIKDDRGVSYSLVSYEGIRFEKEVKGIAILSDELEKSTNGVSYYDETMYFSSVNSAKRAMINYCKPITIKNYSILPVIEGENSFFNNGNGTVNLYCHVFNLKNYGVETE